ncbi:MAG: aminotransferase class V-fold PLP-dependent enzyme [Polyangiales bacterium]
MRSLFPAYARSIYLNHAGVSPCSTRSVDAVSAWVRDLAENGVANEHEWEKQADRVRALCARAIGSEPNEIAFVRNTSHGLGLVAEGLDWNEGDEVAACLALEYPSNVYPWLHLRDRGVSVREIAPRDGGVVAEEVERAIGPRTKLVAVSSVQYATGHATDLDAVGEVCARHGVLLLVDGIQSVGARPIDVKRSKIHFLSADSHKWMLGMPGIGFLYVDRAVIDRLRPVLVGWHSTTDAWNFDRALFELKPDASKFEEGSPSYTGIVGMGAGLEILLEAGLDKVRDRIDALVARLDAGLVAIGCETSPSPDDRAGILTFVPKGRSAADLHAYLTAQGVVLSLRRGRLRASPHFLNTEEEIDRTVSLVKTWLTASTSSPATPR